jgi:hypothetical protein
MGGACDAHGKIRSSNRILAEKPEWERPLRRQRLRWEDNIKIDLGTRFWAWIGFIRLGIGGGLLKSVMNLKFS